MSEATKELLPPPPVLQGEGKNWVFEERKYMESKNVVEIKRINLISTIKVCLAIGIILGLLFDLYAWGLASYFYDSDAVKNLWCYIAERAEREEIVKTGGGAEKAQFTIWSKTIAPTKQGLKYEGIFGGFEASRPSFFFILPIIFTIRTIIFGIVLASIYNIIAKVVGGIRFYTNT